MTERSLQLFVRCPGCLNGKSRSWDKEIFVFPSHPDHWYLCDACNQKIPWDQWLLIGGSFDVTAAFGPIGGLPRLGDVLHLLPRFPQTILLGDPKPYDAITSNASWDEWVSSHPAGGYIVRKELPAK